MITLKRATPEAVRYACLNFHYAKVVPCAIYSYNVYNEAGEWCGCILFGNGARNINTPFGMENRKRANNRPYAVLVQRQNNFQS